MLIQKFMFIILIYCGFLQGAGALETDWIYRWHTPAHNLYRLRLSDGENLLLFKGSLDSRVFSKNPLPLMGVHWGFRTAYVSYGPFKKSGLLRELDNYSRYTFSSEIFREHTGLKLDTSLLVASPRMILITPFPGLLGLYCLDFPEEKWIGGIYGSLPMGKNLRIEGILSTTRGKTEAARLLCHMGTRLIWNSPGLQGVSALMGSYAPDPAAIPQSGLLTHLKLAWKFRFLAPGLFLEYSSPSYFNPGGKQGRNWIKAQLVLELWPASFLSLFGNYKLDLSRPPQQSVSCLPGYEQILLGYRLGWNKSATLKFNLDGKISKTFEYTELGLSDQAFQVENAMGIKNSCFHFYLDWTYASAAQKLPCQKWKSGLKISGRWCEGELNLKILVGEQNRYGGNLGFKLSPKAYSLQLGANIKPGCEVTTGEIPLLLKAPFSYLELKISWQTATP